MGELQWYEHDISLQEAMNCIDENLRASVRNFVAIGFYLKEIRNRKLYQEDGCQNFEDFVRKHYDRDKGWASRCIKVNDQLSKDGNSPVLADEYREYKVSQLVELAYLTEEQRIQANPEMTVKEIQAIRRPEVEPEEMTLQKESFGKQEEKVAISQPQGQIREDHVHEQYRLQERYLYPFAKWLIKNHKEWFLESFQNRVEMVEQSERELKKYLGASRKGDRAYGFPVTSLTKVYARLYDDRIELTQFEGNEMTEVGTSKWFYLSAAVQAMWNEVALEEAQTLRKRTETEPETADPEPEADEIEVDTNTCPPGNGSCRRQEWGTSPEQQKAGHKECVKCWADWKNRQKVLNAAKVQREEIPLPNENWNLGDLPQVKEKYLKQLAEKLVEKMGNRLIREEISGIPSDKSIKKSVQTLDEQEGDGIGLEDCVKAFACAEIVEFSREDEDLGICSYNRLANKVRKTLEGWEAQNETVIDAEYTEVEEPEAVQSEEDSLTDLQIAREELERAQRLLDKCLLDLPDESNINIRRLKTKVDALACYVCELDDIENPPPKPVQPELPLLKNNDQRASFVDDYETWPLWIETVQTGERYYRYDLEDGASMVVKVYHARLFDYTAYGTAYEERFSEGWGKQEYYLLRPGKFFKDCETNRSSLIDKLKEIQKKEKQKQDE